MSRAPGSRIDRFELVAELGRGGMGVVYHARDTDSGQGVALKLLTRVDPQRLLRFLREGQISASLKHPNIVAVHAAGASDGVAWLAFELIDGARTFDQAVAGLSLCRRVELLRDAARALGHAHARGVVHRDVKPGNLLVGADHRVRVADFGVALGCDLERLTLSGAMIGTPLYMAPELLLGRRVEVGPPTDVWALGVMLYETACGRPPFSASTLAALIDDVTLPPPRPRAVAPDVARSLEAVILRAMSVDPAARHADGAALADDLDRFLDGEELAAPPSSGRRRAWWPVAGLLAAAGAVPLAAHLLAPAPSPGPTRPVELVPTRAATAIVDTGAVAAVATTLRGRTDDLMTRADAAANSGRFEEALALYTEVTELDPLADRAWTNRAALRLHLRNPTAAVADATRAIALDAARFEGWLARGMAHAMAGDRARALLDLTRAVDLAPEAAACRLHRARVRAKLGQLEGARDDLDALLTRDAHHVEALVERSKVRRRLDDRAGARSDLDRALAEAGPRVDLLVDRSSVHVLDGDLERALVDLTAAAALGPDDDVLLRRARVLYSLQRLPEGLRDADAALAHSETAAGYAIRSGLRLGARDHAGAIADADEALRRGSTDPMVHAHRGLALGSLGRRGEAVPDLTLAIDGGLTDIQLWQLRGLGLAELKRYDEALADFEHVLAALPRDLSARYCRGRLRRLQGALDGAVDDLTQALELQPRSGGIYLERGLALEALGRTAEAVSDLEQAVLLLSPGDPLRAEAQLRLIALDR